MGVIGPKFIRTHCGGPWATVFVFRDGKFGGMHRIYFGEIDFVSIASLVLVILFALYSYKTKKEI